MGRGARGVCYHSRVRRRAVLPCLAALGLLIVPAATAQRSAPDYGTLTVSAQGKKVKAKRGAYCEPQADGQGGRCAAPKYPLAGAPRITVRRGGTLTLELRASAAHLDWRAVRLEGGKEKPTAVGAAKLVRGSKRKWQIKLPRGLSRSTKILGFYAEYNNAAYSDFEVAVRFGR